MAGANRVNFRTPLPPVPTHPFPIDGSSATSHKSLTWLQLLLALMHETPGCRLPRGALVLICTLQGCRKAGL